MTLRRMAKIGVLVQGVVFGNCHAADIQWLEIGKFTLGAASSVFVHEAGHAATALALGAEIREVGFTHVTADFQGDATPAKVRAFYMSGYLAQNIAAEIILQNKSWHDSSFAVGMFAAAHFTNVANATRYLLSKDASKDFDQFVDSGGYGYLASALMLGYTAWSLYRVNTDTRIIPYMKNNMFGISYKF
jgi:hypothetical protein